MRERECFDPDLDVEPYGSGEIRKSRFSRYSFSDMLPAPQILVNLFEADLRVCRLRKKSAHGSAFLIRSRILSMLNVEGSRVGLTSDQRRGVETGARGLRRAEYGATTV